MENRHLRSKFWMFTLFGATVPQWDPENMCYMVYQQEICPETQRAHFQGYVELKQRTRFGSVVGLFPPGVHLEMRRGTQADAIVYCTKAETRMEGTEPVHFGEPTPTRSGTRTDLDNLKDDIDSGHTLLDIYDKNFSSCAKYYKFVDRYRSLRMSNDTIPEWRLMHVTWIYGDTGVGKTRRAYEMDPNLYKLPMGDQNQLWFDGYDFNDTILLDEFYSQVKYNFFLQILDGYKLRLPTKGGHIDACWTKVIITSQYHPQDTYLNIDQNLKAHMMRRIHEIIHLEQ